MLQIGVRQFKATSSIDIELVSVGAIIKRENTGDDWWEYNVNEQFPVKSLAKTKGKVNIEVGKPHEGCVISITLKKYKNRW